MKYTQPHNTNNRNNIVHQPEFLRSLLHRSEERRVGKECRSRGAPYHSKKKNGISPIDVPPQMSGNVAYLGLESARPLSVRSEASTSGPTTTIYLMNSIIAPTEPCGVT